MPKIVKYTIEMTGQEEAELLWNFKQKELTGFHKLLQKIYNRGDFVLLVEGEGQ